MNVEKLVKMANQIGLFFDAMPDRPQALHDLILHIRRSWDPDMRIDLLSHVDETAGAGLSPLVREALERHRSIL